MDECSISVPNEEVMACRSSKLGGSGFRCRKSMANEPAQVPMMAESSNGDGKSTNLEEARKILENYAKALKKIIFPKIVRLQKNIGLANSAFMGLVLGGFGTFHSAPVFWVCWVILLYDAVIRFVFRPRLVAKLGQDKLAFPFIDSVVGLFKIIPTVALLVLLLKTPLIISDQCQRGSVCYSRLTESLWAIVGLSLLELLPTLFMIVFFAEDMARKIWWILSKFKFLYFLFTKLASLSKPMYLQITARTEGRPGIEQKGSERGRIHILMSNLAYLKSSLDKDFEARAKDELPSGENPVMLVSFVQSAVGVMIQLTVSLLVGGSFGTFMTRNAYWICCCSGLAELLVESIFGERMKKSIKRASSDSGSDDEICWDLSKPFVFASIFRTCAQEPLFGLMVALIHTGGYFSAEIGGCDATCQSRGTELFYVACISAGLQCLVYCVSCVTFSVITIGSCVACAGSLPLIYVANFLAMLVIAILTLFSLLLYFGIYFIITLVGALVDRITGKSFCGTWLGLNGEEIVWRSNLQIELF